MNPTPSLDATDRKTHLEIQKLEAEIQQAQTDRQKAELEILELKRWYRQPSVLQSIAAIIVALVGAIIGTANGWFSTKLDSLKLEQEKVQRDIEDLNKGRSTLHVQIARLQTERDNLKSQLTKAAADADKLSQQVANLQIKAAETDEGKRGLKNLHDSLARVSAQAKTAAQTIPKADPARMIGLVIDDDTRQPIEGASVSLGKVLSPLYTDSNGYVDLSGARGFHSIRDLKIEKPDYIPSVSTVTTTWSGLRVFALKEGRDLSIARQAAEAQ
ncbi:MAG TPA: hypothetical protein VH639_11180 [Bryobacteraceae bacterium]|jgi:hypothetical protein